MKIQTLFFLIFMNFCFMELKSEIPMLQLTDENSSDILQSEYPLIIDIYYDQCGSCKLFLPIFKKAHKRYGEIFQFVKGEVYQNKEFLKQFQIVGLPTLLFIQNGEEKGRHVGFIDEKQLYSKIEFYFGPL